MAGAGGGRSWGGAVAEVPGASADLQAESEQAGLRREAEAHRRSDPAVRPGPIRGLLQRIRGLVRRR